MVKTITILHKAISDDLDDDTGMEDALLELLEVFGEPLQLFPLVVLRYAQFASFISWAKLYSCTATQADAMRRKLKAILLAYPTLLRALRGCFDKWGTIQRMAQARFKSETVTPSVLTALDAFCAESKQFFAAQDGAYNAEAAVSRALESAAHRELQITATLHASVNKGSVGGGGGTMEMAHKLQLQMEAYYTDDRYEAALDSIHGLDPVGILQQHAFSDNIGLLQVRRNIAPPRADTFRTAFKAALLGFGLFAETTLTAGPACLGDMTTQQRALEETAAKDKFGLGKLSVSQTNVAAMRSMRLLDINFDQMCHEFYTLTVLDANVECPEVMPFQDLPEISLRLDFLELVLRLAGMPKAAATSIIAIMEAISASMTDSPQRRHAFRKAFDIAIQDADIQISAIAGRDPSFDKVIVSTEYTSQYYEQHNKFVMEKHKSNQQAEIPDGSGGGGGGGQRSPKRPPKSKSPPGSASPPPGKKPASVGAWAATKGAPHSRAKAVQLGKTKTKLAIGPHVYDLSLMRAAAIKKKVPRAKLEILDRTAAMFLLNNGNALLPEKMRYAPIGTTETEVQGTLYWGMNPENFYLAGKKRDDFPQDF